MQTIVFEDRAVDRLWPLAVARPACDLLIGASTLFDVLGRFGPVRRALRPHLAHYLQTVGGRRVALWGGSTVVPQIPPSASTHGGILLLVNARVVPSRATLVALRSLVEAGRRAVVQQGDAIAAALLHVADAGAGRDQTVAAAVLADGLGATDAIASLGLLQADAAIEMVSLPHEVIGAHEQTIAASLAMQIDSGRFREVRPGLFAAADAEIIEPIVVRGEGPVVIDTGGTIGPFVCLDGPIWIGANTRVNPRAWIRAGTAIGADCRVGGEIEATVMEPFSNKPHDGFVGHSHIGSWVNLAAGTTTGNLKTTYGPVRLHGLETDGRPTVVHTGRQFLGAMMGDCGRTTVNTALPCGARIGVGATVGGAVPEQVASFTNMVVAGGAPTTADQAATILERMMARRGLDCLDADRKLLRRLAAPPPEV